MSHRITPKDTFDTIMSNYEKDKNGFYIVKKGDFDPFEILDTFIYQMHPEYEFTLLAPSRLKHDDGYITCILCYCYEREEVYEAWVKYDVDFEYDE